MSNILALLNAKKSEEPKPIAMSSALEAANNLLMAKPAEKPALDEEITHEFVKEKINELMEYQLQEHPLMPELLKMIHGILISRHDIVSALTDEEIGKIINATAEAKDVVLAKAIAAKPKRISKNVSVDDI